VVCAPDAPISSEGSLNDYARLYSGLKKGYSTNWQQTLSWLFCSADGGVFPPDSWNIRQGNIHKFLIATGRMIPHLGTTSLHRQSGCGLIIPVFGSSGVQTYRQWNRFALCGDVYGQSYGYLKDFNVSCRRMLLSKTEFQLIERGGIIAGVIWDRVSEESSNDNWGRRSDRKM
jgi:hypothetical protein